MPRENLENLATYLAQRTAINDNFTEIYNQGCELGNFEFSTFAITGVESLRHVGSSLSGNQEFVWSITDSTKVTDDIVSIYDITNSLDIVVDTDNDGSYIDTLVVDLDTLTTQEYSISGIDTFNGNEVTKTLSIKTAYYFWHGVSTETSLTEAQILSLTGTLRDGTAGDFTVPSFSESSYIYIIFDESYDDLTSLIIRNLNVLSGFQQLSDVAITENGIAHNVKVYRSNNLIDTTEIGTIITTG